MTSCRLSVGIADYVHVRPLVDGRVPTPGLELTCVQLPVEQILQRTFRHQMWDVAEMSLAQYVAKRSQGDLSLIAIPVFPSRVFRHGAIFVVGEALAEPAELAGKTVGVPEWVQTAGVWVRGILGEEYGLDPASVEWVQAGVHQPGRSEGIEVVLPEGVTVRRDAESTLSELLADGRIHAAISARPPAAVAGGKPPRPLIADYRSREAEWGERTGIFPVMHVVVLRRDVYERSPWIAASLLDAFAAAKQQALAQIADSTVSFVPIPWIGDELARSAASIGGGEWWPYGVDGNRTTLAAFLRYARAQGIAAVELEVEDLFAPETLEEVVV